MHTTLRLLAGLVLIATASCGSEADTTTGDPDSSTQTCSGLGRSQSFSEPCCPDYGADACGAQLFCAAFDGRTQPSCYMEHSREDMTECTADIQCLSGSCSPSARRCRSTNKCAPTIGCAHGLVCVKEQCVASSGEIGASCGSPSDCKDGRTCQFSRCGGVVGEKCSGYECGGDLCCKYDSGDEETCQPCLGGLGDECEPDLDPACQAGYVCCVWGSGPDAYCRESCP